MTSYWKFGIAAAMTAAVVAAPAAAQKYSDSHTFLEAVKDRDAEKVQSLLATPGSTVINTRDRAAGDAALHHVVRERDLTWLSFLIGKGAKIDIQNDNGDTPLALAAQLGWVEGADLLLSQRASVDLANERGETPLILAVLRRELPMVRLLMSKGANPNRTDSVAGYSALDYAKQDRRAASILKLLEPPAAPAREVAGPTL